MNAFTTTALAAVSQTLKSLKFYGPGVGLLSVGDTRPRRK